MLWSTGVNSFEIFLYPWNKHTFEHQLNCVESNAIYISTSNDHAKLNTLESLKYSKMPHFYYMLHDNLKLSFVAQDLRFLESQQQFLSELHKIIPETAMSKMEFFIIVINCCFRRYFITKIEFFQWTHVVSNLVENHKIYFEISST